MRSEGPQTWHRAQNAAPVDMEAMRIFCRRAPTAGIIPIASQKARLAWADLAPWAGFRSIRARKAPRPWLRIATIAAEHRGQQHSPGTTVQGPVVRNPPMGHISYSTRCCCPTP